MLKSAIVGLFLTVHLVVGKRYVVSHAPGTTGVSSFHRKLHSFTSIGASVYELNATEVAALHKDSTVKVYEDLPVSITALVQKSPPAWGLDRIDQNSLPLDNRYLYPKVAGKGANVFIIDTGVHVNHVEFTKRAVFAKNFVGDSIDDDCNGHGTHVASIVGGTNVGVAKQTKIYAIKVLGCDGSGSFSNVMAGIQYVIDYQKTAVNKRTIINMSLGGGFYKPVNDMVEAAVAAGITVVVAAGNENADACNTSPASAPSAITVAASEITDNRASYSNFGSCVDIYAPGSNIYAAFGSGSSNTTYATLSGTSMASPHVAGTAALYLGSKVALTPVAVHDRLLTDASDGKIKGNVGVTVNKLLFLKNNFT